jgi:D-sedoheptulose 7-phosphate isomerase
VSHEPLDVVRHHLIESARTKERTAETQAARVVQAAETIVESFRRGGKVLLCGNGGSAGDAQHIAAELVVRLTPKCERQALPAISLSTDTSLLTACGNDYGYDRIFSRQVEALAKPEDVVWGITTSGKIPNIVAAFAAAKAKGAKTLLFSAGDGAKCAPLADVAILVPSKDVAHIQEAHISCGHAVCELIERLYCGRND